MPVVPAPKPTVYRAVVCLEPQPVSRYFKKPWLRSNLHLRVVGSVRISIPVALDGVVPDPVYIETIAAVEQRAKHFRGGPATALLLMFHTVMLITAVLGFFVDKSILGYNFFSPITLSVLISIELVVILYSAFFFQREEKRLVSELLELLQPWKESYGIVAKVRKARGKLEENGESTTFYCLVLEKRGFATNNSADTASLSWTQTNSEDEESQSMQCREATSD